MSPHLADARRDMAAWDTSARADDGITRLMDALQPPMPRVVTDADWEQLDALLRDAAEEAGER